jgi:hypothetical protein
VVLATRRNAADEIGALGGPLLLSADKDATTAAQTARRLEPLAAHFVESTARFRPGDNRVEYFAAFWYDGAGLRRLEEASV